tara:strand:+ start:111 stop:1313 length:1203 start_codon:yes stop_codon:yes gene_type:complete
MPTNTENEQVVTTVMGGRQRFNDVVVNTEQSPLFRGEDPITKKTIRFVNNQDRGKYQIDNYSYPSGIGKDKDKQHFIQFFINVRGKSKFNTEPGLDGRTFETFSLEGEFSNQNRLDPDKAGQALTAGAALSAAKVAGGGALLSDIAKGGFSGLKIGAAAGAGALGAKLGLDFATQKGLSFVDKPKRLKDSIVLHIQDRPTTNYSVEYQEDSLGTLGGALGGGTNRDISEMVKQFGDMDSAQQNKAGSALIAAVSGAIGGTGARLAQSATKEITNAFREQFFERVAFRTFNFRHTFMPKSREEAQNVRNIIELFKFHMLPELGFENLTFIHPSEFEIKYFFGSTENNYFDRISTCVLEDMSVEYGGDIFSTFSTGQPVEVNMSLRFKELEVMTKERVKEGF